MSASSKRPSSKHPPSRTGGTAACDFPGLLAKLTGFSGWQEYEDVGTGVGLDRFFKAPNGGVLYAAWISIEKTRVEVRVGGGADEAATAKGGSSQRSSLYMTTVDDAWSLSLDTRKLAGTGYEDFIEQQLRAAAA